MTELWKPIADFPTYQISSLGRVKGPGGKGHEKGFRSPVIRKLKISHKGYLIVDLRDKKRRKDARVHRLVLEAFVGPCPENHSGDHINFDKLDARLENLRWLSTAENNRRRKRKQGK